VSLFPQEVCLYDNRNAAGRIQVFERGDRLELRFGNSIVQSAMSRRVPDLLLLEYTRALLTCMLLVQEDANILHIGLGAGTIPAFIFRHFPAAQQRVIELNGEVIAVAERFFGLPRSARLQVVEDDGLNYLRSARETFDLVVFDAFHAEGAAPQLTTPGAFSLARQRLKPQGWLVNNAWGSDAVRLRGIVTALKERFTELHTLSVRHNSNVIVFAASPARAASLGELRKRAAALSARMPLDFEPWLKQIGLPGPIRFTVPE
jgi:spermidine synthase